LTWGEERGLKWIPLGFTTRYLGFPVGYQMKQKDKNDKILQQIRSKLSIWTNKKLSMAARVLVTNQVVLASIWYIASCADISKVVLHKARTLVCNFVWGGDANKTPEHEWRGP
jgi:hypothetical protein